MRARIAASAGAETRRSVAFACRTIRLVPEPEVDIESIVEETIEFVTVRPDGDGWVGDAPDWFGERLFGGFVVSQSVHAVTRTAPDAVRIHSLHGYFLRPVLAGKQLSYRVSPL